MTLSTQDILFVVLAFCALWFTIFLCWLIYQAAQLLKRVHGLVDEVRSKVHGLESAFNALRSRFDGSFEMVNTIAGGVKRILEALRVRGGGE